MARGAGGTRTGETGLAADAVVIGAGVIGASVALELSKRGLRVIGVDKSAGPGHGSTSASSAVVRFNYSTADGVATSWESKHCWEGWEAHLGFTDPLGLAHFHRTGMVMLDTPVSPRERVVSLLEQVGVPYEEWDAEELRRRVPGIDVGRYWPPKPVDDDAFYAGPSGELGALYTPDAGFVDDPQLAARNLAIAAAHHGARYVFNRRVVEVRRARSGRVAGVALDDGEHIASPVVVNAAGPWSGALNHLAGVGDDFTIGVRPLRQEVHRLAAPDGYNGPDGRLGPSIADLDLGVYIRPDLSGGLLVGGTEPACDPLQWLDDADELDPTVTVPRFLAQATRAARRLDDLVVPSRPLGVAGAYDVSDDWAPIYDKTGLDGFYVAIGTSGNQFKNAPLVGRFIAELVTRVEAGHDHDAVPIRYSCEHTGLVVNLGAFSRHRPLNPDTSGTVMG